MENLQQDILLLDEKEFYKWIINSYEGHLKSYKEIMTYIYKNKEIFEDEFGEWFKGFVREGINESKQYLKRYRKEYEYFLQGLNPPCCYPEYWK